MRIDDNISCSLDAEDLPVQPSCKTLSRFSNRNLARIHAMSTVTAPSAVPNLSVSQICIHIVETRCLTVISRDLCRNTLGMLLPVVKKKCWNFWAAEIMLATDVSLQ